MTKYIGVIAPLLVLVLVSSLQVAGYIGLITPPAVFLDEFTRQLGSGSLILIAVCSFFEGLAVFNIYFPGSIVILYGMAATHGDLSRALTVFVAIVTGSTLAHQADYWAGRLLARTRVIDSSTNSAAPTFAGSFASYWHPHLGSLYSLRSGADCVAYLRFLARFALAFGLWNIFWGVLMYQLGRVPVSGSEFLFIFYAYLGWWLFQEIRAMRSRPALTGVQE